MRLVEIQHFLGRAEFCEQLQHVAVKTAVGLGVELAVRKRARAALAELHVGIDVQYFFAEEFFYCRAAFFHGFAALDYYRAEAALDKPKRAEKPRGSRAYHGDRRGIFYFFGRRLLRSTFVAEFYRIQPENIAFIARVERLFYNSEILQAAERFFGYF